MIDRLDNIRVSQVELINTFSEIDTKINDLHQRSSDDFIQLNTYLKDYHKKSQIISENAFRVLDTIAGSKDIDLTEELVKVNQRLEECREKIKDEDNRKIQAFKVILLESTQLNLAFRNIRQDFTTFKFLSSNYSLISNYEDFNLEWQNRLDIWNSEMLLVLKSVTSVSSRIEEFKEQILANINHLESRAENTLKVFQKLSKETKANISSILFKSRDSKQKFPLLKEKASSSSRSISNIITHLQYHDIIRQKIEHIQHSHHKIIDDLNLSIVTNDNTREAIPNDFVKIGDIADLQAAQLLMVNKEYQSALDIITRNFQSIANDVTTISSISDEFSYKDNYSEITLLKQIKNQLDEGIILLDLNHFREINAKYLLASKCLEEISTQIISQIRNPLDKLIPFDELDNNKSQREFSVPSVPSQIISLTNDIKIKNHEISERIKNLLKLSGSIFAHDELLTWENKLEQDRIELMVSISRILDTLDKDNIELDKVLNENKVLNFSILEKIENVISKADYYDYFETMVDQVIRQLNCINNRIRPAASDNEYASKMENLREIKNSYTMESERIVHDRVVTDFKDTDNSKPEITEDEIEFF
jgi:hypothetical protein